jgi:hypothetical protein
MIDSDLFDKIGTQFTRFTGTKVQILTQKGQKKTLWRSSSRPQGAPLVLSLLALLVQKYTV